MTLDEREAVAKAATLGPWTVSTRTFADGSGSASDVVTAKGIGVAQSDGAYPACNNADAAHIAANSPSEILALCAHLRAAEAVVDAARMLDTVQGPIPPTHWRRTRLREALATYDTTTPVRAAGGA